MKLVERIDAKDKADVLTEQERDDFFTKMVMGKDVTEEIDTSRGKFTVKYPKPKDMLLIGKIAAFRRNYKPVDGFDAATESDNIIASTLDVLVVSGPPWYKEAQKANENFSFMEVPSRAFLAELYGKAYSFREEVDKRINEEEKSTGKRVSSEEGADDAVDSGLFGGLASE